MPTLASNPYADIDWDAVEPHRAQFHTHTSRPAVDGHSGDDPPAAVVDAYRDAGYAALSLNEHEYNVEELTWPWTRWDRDPDELGMVAVQGVELGGSADADRIQHDVLSLFNDLDDSTGMTIDEALTEIGERGGLAIFSHPGRYHEPDEWEFYAEYFRRHPHLLGLEVVNATDRYPDDRTLWDRLQSELGADRPVWGFANDDFHGRDRTYGFDRSRNALLLEELSEAAVTSALVDGRFYYQHAFEADADPPDVDAVVHDAGRGELTVRPDGPAAVEWIGGGTIVERGETLRYREAVDSGHVRARIVDDEGAAGTQPFFFA